MPSNVAVGDILRFSIADSPDPAAFQFASASRKIVAPGTISSDRTTFFSGSWANGLRITGAGFPHSSTVTVTVRTGSDQTAVSDLITPITAATSAAGELTLAIPATSFAALPSLPGTAHTYYQVTAVDAFGNRSPNIELSVRPAAPGTGLAPATVAPADTVKVTAAGLQPNEPVEVWLHSTPVKLLSTLATASGTFSRSIPIPEATAIGAHQLEIRGATSGSQWLALSVDAPAVTDVPAVTLPSSPGGALSADGSTWSTRGGQVVFEAEQIDPDDQVDPEAEADAVDERWATILPELSVVESPRPTSRSGAADGVEADVGDAGRLGEHTRSSASINTVALTTTAAGLLLIVPLVLIARRISQRRNDSH